ncbi:Trypomastigote Alanine Serine and Valine rich protein (TASV) subfamily B [Trypanosoma cruzi]|uniref:Trypomastigote Alanine Serine and Valine rich protein (TASV) subfamily B n=1 Tax=Trypanosoma cruzi TaxID=5693 RepID=A0A7J6Y5R9_TRYCR|nr:Trypomastigote Alanine Serine and Valine rich protein (TASV) subfamily B [Trypanosoma cruzi]
MMMMVTVRRRVVCDLLILALLCCCCCLSVCGTAVPAKTLMDVHVSCSRTDGKLIWRLPGETGWRKCANKPAEGGGGEDECALVCIAAEYVYKDAENNGLCAPGGRPSVVWTSIGIFLSENIKNCSSAAAPTAAVVGQAQSGVGSPPGEAAETPQKKSPEHTDEGGSYPKLSENFAVSLLTSTDTNEHVASAPEASSQTPSSPSGDNAAQETSHNNNEGNSQADVNGGGTATGMRDPGGADSSDAAILWVRTPLLLLLFTALICAAVR